MTVSVPPEWREAMRAGSFVCHYCPAAAETWDHIVPRGLGGPDQQANLVPACPECNHAKADSLPTCRCCRCRTALRWWQVNLPEETRRRLSDSLRAEVVRLASVVAALAEPVTVA